MNLQNIIAQFKLTLDQANSCVRKALSSEAVKSPSTQGASLEERVLFSASPIAEMVIDIAATNPSVDQLFESPTQQNASELVIVDSNVEDYQSLLADLDENSNLLVVTLSAERDGVEQISEILDQFNDLSAVHIISHGSAGEVTLGNTVLNSQTITAYAAEISQWSGALETNADILIYGCEVAENDAGKQLLDELSALTGADVAGSTDLTGHASLGGNWYFEYQVGLVETAAATSQQIQSTWSNTLLIAGSGEIQANQNSTLPEAEIEATSKTVRGSDSAIGIAADGSYVTVWTGATGTSEGDNVYFQKFDRFGNPIGNADLVNQVTTGNQDDASIAMHSDGSFIVVWESNQNGNSDIYMRRFDADGNPLGNSGNPSGDEFLVHQSYSSGEQKNPDIAINNAGQFSIVWDGDGSEDSQGIYARTFDADGTPNSAAFFVNDSASGNQANAAVGIDGSGNTFVIWDYIENVQSQARKFDFDGNALTAVISAPTLFGTQTQNGTIDTREDGYSAIALRVDTALTTESIVVIIANPDLTYQFDVFDLPFANDSTTGSLLSPSVRFHDDDSILVAWEGPSDAATVNDALGVYYREMTAVDQGNGFFEAQTVGAETTINQTLTGSQHYVSLASVDKDNWVAVWSGEGVGDSNGVFVRQFGDPVTLDLDFDDSVLAGSDYQADFQANSGGVLIADSDTLITSQTGQLNSLTVTISNLLDGNSEVLTANTGGYGIAQAYDSVTGVLTLSGTASVDDYRQVLQTVMYNNSLAVPDTTQRVINVTANSSDGVEFATATSSVNISAIALDGIWLATDQDVNSSGVTGLNSWLTSELIQIADPGLALEPSSGTTAGSVSSALNLADFTANDVAISGLHYVTQDVTIPGGINLFAGDILFSTEHTETFTGYDLVDLTVNPGDIAVFRPDSGQFLMAFSNPAGAAISAFTLVEQDTLIGDTFVQEGDLIFAAPGSQQVLQWYRSSLASSVDLIDGNDLGFSNSIRGIELIEEAVELGGVSLNSGELILALDGTGSVAGTAFTARDLVKIDPTATTLQAADNTARATSILLFEGADLGFDSVDENVAALTLNSSILQVNSDPIATNLNQNQPYNEGDAVESLDDIVVTDSDVGDQITATLTLNNTSTGSLSASSGNGETYNSTTGVWTVTGDVATVNAALAAVDFLPNPDNDVDTTITTLVVDSAANSPLTGTISLDVTPVSDPPVEVFNFAPVFFINSGDSVIANTSLSYSDVDNTADQLIYTVSSGPSLGTLKLVGFGDLNNGDTFSQADIDAGNLLYAPNTGASGSDIISLSLTDGSNTESFTFEILIGNTVDQGSSDNVLGQDIFLVTEDPVSYRVDTLPAHGELFLDDGFGTLSLLGVNDTFSQADYDAGLVSYVHDGTATWSDSFVLGAVQGSTFEDIRTVRIQIVNQTDTLFVSFKGNQTFTDSSLDVVGEDIVAIGGADFRLGAATAGVGSLFFTGPIDPGSFHFVNSTTSVNFGTPTTLNAGDILFSIRGVETDIPGISPTHSDIIVYRPYTPGFYDFNQGTFEILASVPSGEEINGLTLVESDTVIGNTPISSGSILFTDDNAPFEIHLLTHSIDPMDSSTIFASSLLFDGSQIGIDNQLNGLDLIEQRTHLGGVNVEGGTFLIAVEVNNNNLGTNDIDVDDNDIVALDVSATEFEGSGSSAAVASILFEDDSADLNLSGGGNGDIDAISIFQDVQRLVNNSALVVDEGASDIIQTSELSTIASGSPSDLVYTVTGAPANGQILLSGMAASSFTQEDIDNNLVSYVHDGSETTFDSFDFEIHIASSLMLADTFDINVNPVNDAPELDLDADNDSGATGFDYQASFNEGDSPIYVTDSDLAITDVDDTEFLQVIIQLGGFADGISEEISIGSQQFEFGNANTVTTTVGSTQFNISFDGAEFVITENGGGVIPIADFENLLRNIEYENISSDPTAGTRTFGFTIRDDGGDDSALATSSIAVAAVNNDPNAIADSFTTNEDTAFTATLGVDDLLLNDSDPEGDSLTVNTTPVMGPSNGALSMASDGTFTYTPDSDFFGSDSFVYEVSDGNGGFAQATVNITVIATNDDPTTSPVVLSAIAEDSGPRTITQLELLGNASDVDGDSLTAVGLTISSGGGVLADNGDGTWNYTPALNDNAGVTFSYTITDSVANIAGSASLDITPVNDDPTTTPVVLSAIAEDSGPRTITQLELLGNASDVDGDSLTAVGLTISSGGGVLADNGDGTWNYTPALNDNTSVTFSYTITDSVANIAGSASLDITPVNDDPTTTPVVLSAIAEDSGPRTITQLELLGNASDVDGDSLTAVGLTISSGGGVLVDNGDGTWDYTPALNDDSSVTFSYTITDSVANIAGSASLDITPVNDDPTTTPVVLSAIAEDSGPRTITQLELLGNASDDDGDSLTAVGLTISSGGGVLADNGDGTWDYTPALNDDSSVTFSYTITDSVANIAGGASLDITPVNDALKQTQTLTMRTIT